MTRQDKETTKVGFVYDASARANGPSLNDCLHTGPKFSQKILEILLRFRSYKVALVAGIEKAFLTISVAPRDRDVLRFLWVKDISCRKPEVVALRFTRVVFGVSSSPFLLNATVEHHIAKYLPTRPELVKTLMQSMYVDDVVCGAVGDDEAYALYADSKEILSQGSFNLGKFLTNSPALQERIDKEETKRSLQGSAEAHRNPLGVETLEQAVLRPLSQPTTLLILESLVCGGTSYRTSWSSISVE